MGGMGFLDDIPDLEISGKGKTARGRRPVRRGGHAAAAGGLKCPQCGCGEFETINTIAIPGGIRRYKRCRRCGLKARTVERLDLQNR